MEGTGRHRARRGCGPPAEASGVAKIEIASTSAEITKASAIKALGKSAEEYTIIALEEAKQK